MSTNKVLVPLDFSDCSANALRGAINLARKSGAELVLLHAYHVPVPHVEAGASAIVQPLIEGYEESVESDFKQLEEKVTELSEVTYQHRIVHGFATDAIRNVAESEDVDLIIMGTKGASGLIGKFIGSITSQVIKEANKPVLAIPGNADLKEIGRIALATDNKPVNSRNTFGAVVELSQLYDAEIHILNIQEDESHRLESGDQVIHQLLPEGVKHSYHCCSNPSIEEGILQYIQEEDIQLVAILPRHHSMFERIFTTSLTEKLAFHTSVPLMAIHEPS